MQNRPDFLDFSNPPAQSTTDLWMHLSLQFLHSPALLFRKQNPAGPDEMRARAASGAGSAAVVSVAPFVVLFVVVAVGDFDRVRQRKVQNNIDALRLLRPGTGWDDRLGEADSGYARPVDAAVWYCDIIASL